MLDSDFRSCSAFSAAVRSSVFLRFESEIRVPNSAAKICAVMLRKERKGGCRCCPWMAAEQDHASLLLSRPKMKGNLSCQVKLAVTEGGQSAGRRRQDPCRTASSFRIVIGPRSSTAYQIADVQDLRSSPTACTQPQLLDTKPVTVPLQSRATTIRLCTRARHLLRPAQ